VAANRYAEMVRWMAWPRSKNSRSSAQPGTYPHDGVQATVTPAPDAEPPPGSGQNTGVSGTRHAVAHDPQGYGSPTPGTPRTARRLRPIRYAHEQPDEAVTPAAPTGPAATPTMPVPAVPAGPDAAAHERDAVPPRERLPDPALAVSPRSPIPPRTTVRPDIMPADDDPGSGPVLTGRVVPRSADTTRPSHARGPGAAGSAPSDEPAPPAGPAPSDAPPPDAGSPDAGSPDEPVANEGLGIFGGVTTTEATDDPPPRSYERLPWHRPLATEPGRGAPPGRAPGGSRPAGGTPGGSTPPPGGPEPGPVIAIGARWNQSDAAEPAASQPEQESEPKSFGILRGLLRGGEADDDGHPRVTMRDLPPDVQLRFWRLRITLMVIVGAVFAALTRSWEIALTLAILAGIVDTVYRSRNAANYVVSGPHPGARKRTRAQLARMGREGFFSLQDRPIPNSKELIDHLVVGPSGVYAIDSEKWDAKLPIRTLNGKRLYLGPESQKERLDHAAWEASQASELLSEALGSDIQVRPALAIYGPKIPWDIASIRNVDVFTGQALRKYLKQRGKTKEGPVRLTREEVRTIYEAAERVLPAAGAQASTTAPVG